MVLLIGANIADNHPILCQYLEANPQQDADRGRPARHQDRDDGRHLHLPLKPRSDLALLNGIAHILIRHNLIDRDYIERHTTGFDELARFLEAYTPERVSRDHRPERGADFQDRAAVWPRQGRLHRLDHGRESQHARARRP